MNCASRMYNIQNRDIPQHFELDEKQNNHRFTNSKQAYSLRPQVGNFIVHYFTHFTNDSREMVGISQA